MWSILSHLSVLCVFSCIVTIRCLEKRDIPWFMHENAIYYIKTNPSYTSNEARNICIEKNMMFTMSARHIQDILNYITSVYGDYPSFWTYDNDKYSYVIASSKLTGVTTDSCYKLNTLDSDYRKENCTAKLGFLCKRNFVGASLYFVNGTHQNIHDSDDVGTYCNPHSQEYDDVLELCLIQYFNVSPNLFSAKWRI